MVVDRQKGQNQISPGGTEWQTGQGRQNGQAGGYKVQKQARVKTGRTRKRRMQNAGEPEKRWLTWKHTRRTGTERQETQG